MEDISLPFSDKQILVEEREEPWYLEFKATFERPNDEKHDSKYHQMTLDGQVGSLNYSFNFLIYKKFHFKT